MAENNLEKLAQKAIDSALKGDWEQAIFFNQSILNQDPKNIDALNRLGRSLLEKGKPKDAQKVYRRVIKIDPYNLIAQKSLERLKSSSKNLHSQIDPNLFLEEPGKTKTVFLTNVFNKNLKDLRIGEEVSFKIAKDKIGVFSEENKKIGSLDKNFSQYLKRLIRLGNRYQTHIILLEKEKVGIFIREVKRGSRLKDFPSFPTNQNQKYHSSLKGDLLSLISDQPEMEIVDEALEEDRDSQNSSDDKDLEKIEEEEEEDEDLTSWE